MWRNLRLKTVSPAKNYLAIMLCAVVGAGLAIGFAGLVNRDHFASIPNDRGPTWYRDWGGDTVIEIQDQDLFYHHIGSSIDDLRHADIVMVGSSLVAFGLDPDVIKKEISGRFGLKFYNLSFMGMTGGDFSRLLMQKYSIRPKILIINADDGGGGGSFFSRGLTLNIGGVFSPIPSTEYGRLQGFKEVIRKNLHWRLERMLKEAPGSEVLAGPDRSAHPSVYRDAQTGMYDMTEIPPFNLGDNPPVAIKMPQPRHASADVINYAREYSSGSADRIILTLVPNLYYDEQQAREIAAAIGAELVLSGSVNYSSWDGGGHLDHRGAVAFSHDLADALQRSETFKALIASRR